MDKYYSFENKNEVFIFNSYKVTAILRFMTLKLQKIGLRKTEKAVSYIVTLGIQYHSYSKTNHKSLQY